MERATIHPPRSVKDMPAKTPPGIIEVAKSHGEKATTISYGKCLRAIRTQLGGGRIAALQASGNDFRACDGISWGLRDSTKGPMEYFGGFEFRNEMYANTT